MNVTFFHFGICALLKYTLFQCRIFLCLLSIAVRKKQKVNSWMPLWFIIRELLCMNTSLFQNDQLLGMTHMKDFHFLIIMAHLQMFPFLGLYHHQLGTHSYKANRVALWHLPWESMTESSTRITLLIFRWMLILLPNISINMKIHLQYLTIGFPMLRMYK